MSGEVIPFVRPVDRAPTDADAAWRAYDAAALALNAMYRDGVGTPADRLRKAMVVARLWRVWLKAFNA